MKTNSILLIFSISLFSCENMIEVDDPTNQMVSSSVYEDPILAESAVNGIYGSMRDLGISTGGVGGLSVLAGLSSDELFFSMDDDNFMEFYNNNLLTSNSVVLNLWNGAYRNIYLCNSAMEGLLNSTKLNNGLRSRLRGEALFLRAFNHYYLVSLFGEIPYISTTDYQENNLVEREDIPAVIDKMILDLNEAKELLPEDYSLYSGSRTRANKYTSSALLSRLYLLRSEWQKAEAEASLIIDNAILYDLQTDLSQSFKMDNQEAIWQLANRSAQNYTDDGGFFLGQSPAMITLKQTLVNSFEDDDLRLDTWVIASDTSFLPFKYQDGYESTTLSEYQTVFRLAEQYLIRAEARAKHGTLIGVNSAQSDINEIRNRAGLDNTGAATEPDIIEAIIAERRHELFLEWGHRWIDLKRFGIANEVLNPIKLDWEITDVLYPIPYSERILNKNLAQNDGY